MGKVSRRKTVKDNQSVQVRHKKGINSWQELQSGVRLKSVTSAIRLIPILLLVLISFAVYFNALFGNFVFDDESQIVNNPWIKDFRNISTIFTKSVWSFQSETIIANISNYYRPLMHLLYMLNYHLFGLTPWGFHLVNIILHCGVSVLVFLLIRRLLPEHGEPVSPTYFSPPFVAAILFASHPIHTEAVTWIAGLPDLAFTFFYLLSFYLYVRSKALLSGSYLFSVVCFAIAAFFKEPALTLPVILFAHDYVFRQKQNRFYGYVKRYVPYLLIAAVYLALRIHALGTFAPQKAHATLSAYQNAINVLPLFNQYLVKLIVPLNLNAFHVFRPIFILFELKGVLSLVSTIVFLATFIIALKRNMAVFFGLVFVTVPLLPVLYIPALGENTFAERYLYLPSVGYALLLAIFLSWAYKKLARAAKTKLSRGTVSLAVAIMGLFGMYSIGTVNRNAVWKDSYTLFADTVSKSPDAALPRNYFGNALFDNGRIDEAIEQYKISVKLKPDWVGAHNDLGNAYNEKGLADEAIVHLQFALALRPDLAMIHNNLGNSYRLKGWNDKAIVQYETALSLKPDYAEAYFNLGNVYFDKGWIQKAIEYYQTALRIKPDFTEAQNGLRNALDSRGG